MKEGSPLRLISYFINIPGSGNKPYGLPAREAARWFLTAQSIYGGPYSYYYDKN